MSGRQVSTCLRPFREEVPSVSWSCWWAGHFAVKELAINSKETAGALKQLAGTADGCMSDQLEMHGAHFRGCQVPL